MHFHHLFSFFDGEFGECASLVDRGNIIDNRTQTDVQCQVGDEALKEMGVTRIAAIKIDVDGVELQAMKNLKNNLTSQRSTTFFVCRPIFTG